MTVSVTDANDNRPVFDQESYSISVSETANAGQLITTITAKDLDSGKFGDQGIRYSLSGTGANLFHVDQITGAISVANCSAAIAGASAAEEHDLTNVRRKRQYNDDDIQYENEANNVNLTLVGETGIIPIDPYTDEIMNLHYNKMEYSTDETPNSLETSHMRTGVPIVSNGTKYIPGVAPCLDFETQPVYFLSYKVVFNYYLFDVI